MSLLLFAILALLIHTFQTSSIESSTGIVICSGEGDIFLELLALLFDFQQKIKLGWKGPSLPITIAHCNELSRLSHDIILHFFNNINVFGIKVDIVNICSKVTVKTDHIKGFLCKPMVMRLY